MEERIIELEIKAAHQEHLLAQLNDVVREFAGRVERLERDLSQLRETASSAVPVGPADEPPPHY